MQRFRTVPSIRSEHQYETLQATNDSNSVRSHRASGTVMAEQITHKKISRLNSKSNREKRQLLKEYYRLNKEQQDKERLTEEQNQEAKHEQTDGHAREGAAAATATAAEENKPISESTLAELLHTHNKLLGKETEANSTIKNTIYENYYDLIKVNDLLKQVATEKDDTLRELKKTLDMLKDV